MSCGSGSVKAEDPQSRFLKSVISLSNDFFNVFTSFADMVGSVLGFNTNTKKSDVGNYFKTVQNTVQGTKDKLNKIVEDMKSENNPNADATDIAVKALITNTLDKIIEGAKTASEAISDAGAAGDANNLKKVAADAAKAVGAVTGADILKAMVKNTDAVKLATNNTVSAVGVATANNSKDAIVAGGIALRAMANDGKFAGSSDNANADAKKVVEGAAISAVTKVLDTLAIAIRNTIDTEFKTVKEAMKINPNNTPLTTDNTTSEARTNNHN
ncbi:variable large family protein (plasmid) [Borrelia parkeri]|uniref:variable large family protein n=1 Tax=Borrelia parkeri TaxID=141 RepID=UPI001FF54FAB|nr:variable large family protein [Borrelia parkeri]UPA11646.1 variable large family protein [Borrelia parkeri]